MHDYVIIGRTLARLRSNAGMSQEDLARGLQLLGMDISRDAIANLERGRANLTIPLAA